MAKKHGWNDLQAAFAEPLSEWKATVLSAEDRHLLGIFEIALVNHEYEPDDGSVIPGRQFQDIKDAILAAEQTLLRAHKAGKRVEMIGGDQVAAWMAIIGGNAKRKRGTKATEA